MCNALLFSIYFLINASHNPLNWFHNLSMGCCFGNTGICGEIVLHPERKGWGWGRAGVAPGFLGSVLSRSPPTSLAINLTARVTTASCSWTLQSSLPAKFPVPPVPPTFSSKDHPEFPPDLWISWPGSLRQMTWADAVRPLHSTVGTLPSLTAPISDSWLRFPLTALLWSLDSVWYLNLPSSYLIALH